jgi:DNA/RNA endonuclease G (NUC1)
VVELIQVSVSIVESAGSEKEEVSGVDENTSGQTTPQNQKAEAHTEAPAKSIESEQKDVVKKEFEYKAGGPSGLEVEDTSGPIGNREGWNKHIEGFQTQDTAKLSAETMEPTMGEKSNEEGGTEHHTNMNFHEYSEAEAAIGLRIDWDPQAGRPRLVSYNFTAEAAAVPSQASDRSFHQEKRLKGESAQSKEKEYLNSGWEKGHLAQREAGKVDPNIDADLGITPTGEDVERSLDVLTNVVPMTPALNKGQEWRSAERRTAKYAEDEGYVTVEIIPIYDVNPPRLQVNGTPIPRQILRIIKSGPTGRILESQLFENK